jgi:hypothetical protein
VRCRRESQGFEKGRPYLGGLLIVALVLYVVGRFLL